MGICRCNNTIVTGNVEMKRVRLKFRGKVLLSLISAVVVISGGVQYFINNQVSGEILSSANRVISAKVEGIKDHVEAELRMDKTILEVLSIDSSVKAAAMGEGTACSKLLARLTAENEQFEAIVVADAEGKVTASNMERMLGTDISDRKYFKETIKGNGYVGEVVRSKASGSPVFNITAPVIDGGKVVGIIMAVNRMDYIFETLIAPVKEGKTGYGFINDASGVLLAHPNKELILDKDFPNRSSATTDIVKNGQGSYRYYWAPIDAWKVTHIEITSNGWYICYTVPEYELLEVLEYINILSIVGGLILIGGISLVVIYVIGGVARIINVLNSFIRSLAQGEINTSSENERMLQKALKRSDEFAEMSEAVVSIQEYFTEMSGVADRMAHKDLNVAVKPRSKNDIMGNAFSRMIENFNDALEQVSVSVGQVSQGAEQVSSASQELSAGAIDQVGHIQKISAAMEQLRSRTSANAENAGSANLHAAEANSAALKGQEEMASLSSAMESMSVRASEVQNIIKTIDDIAFQTNLLALNAAVEAARAGAHGKGFAVVAEEVRNLAARSAKAAGETAVLIESVVTEIDHGNKMTVVTAQSLNNIVEAISRATELVGNIAESMNEEAASRQGIGDLLGQIEHVTQSNSASSEETASASEEMSGMAVELNTLIAEFNLAGIRARSKAGTLTGVSPRKSLQTRRSIRQTPPKNAAAIVRPSDEIKLDDDEFGKF